MQNIFPQNIIDLAQRVVTENKKMERTIALAESCTGGLVSAALTEIPGSSDVLDRSFITYSNQAKREMLNVTPEIIETFGAVSVAVAWEMAQGALANSDADIAVAITGIAGPGGGSELKPVGTVVFACAHRGENPEDINAKQEQIGNDNSRADIRLEAVQKALELLLT